MPNYTELLDALIADRDKREAEFKKSQEENAEFLRELRAEREESKLLWAENTEFKLEIKAAWAKYDLEREESRKKDIIIQECRKEIVLLKAKVKEQDDYIKLLLEQNRELSERVESLETRLALLDVQMGYVAPTVRRLLEGDESVLLQEDYLDIRDSEETSEFSSTSDIITIHNLDCSRYKSRHGMTSKLGRSLAEFYRVVLGYSPRQIKGRSGYWLVEESPVLQPGIDLAMSLKVA